MLQKLRSLSGESKKKITIFLAAFFTLCVFVFWAFHFFGLFGDTLRNVKENGSAAFQEMEKNIGDLYNGFEVNMKGVFGTTTATTTQNITNQASSTEATSTTTGDLP